MPETYSPEERERIVERVIAGLSEGTPLTVLCRKEGMPCDRTIRNWADENPGLASDIARAREAGFDAIAIECLEIADHAREDVYEDSDGNERTNTEVIQRSRLRVETRLKLLAKWDPKRYGDMVKVGNPDGSSLAPQMDETAKFTRLAAMVAAAREAGGESSNDAG